MASLLRKLRTYWNCNNWPPYWNYGRWCNKFRNTSSFNSKNPGKLPFKKYLDNVCPYRIKHGYASSSHPVYIFVFHERKNEFLEYPEKEWSDCIVIMSFCFYVNFQSISSCFRVLVEVGRKKKDLIRHQERRRQFLKYEVLIKIVTSCVECLGPVIN